MVATVNPCGFAMLPAYLSLLLTDPGSETRRSGVWAGAKTGLVVTLAFVATFSVVGAFFKFVSTEIVGVIPWAALVVGVVLAVAGVAVLMGRHLPLRLARVRFSADGSVRSAGVFGVAYAVASVSCTLPIFLSVTAAATTATNPVGGVAVFAAYGLGMGIVLIALAIAVASSRDAFIRHLRRLMPYVERIGGWLLIAAGVFIVYYWTTLLTVDVTSGSGRYGPIMYVEGVSAWFTNQIADNPIRWAAALTGVVLIITGFEMGRRRRTDRGADDTNPATHR